MTLALELDPLSQPINTSMGFLIFAAKRYDEAVDQLRKSAALDPNFQLTHQLLAASLEQLEQFDEAVAEYIQAIPEPAGDRESVASHGQAYADSGITGFRRVYAVIVSQLSERRLETPVFVAAIYMSLGERGAAFEWREKAFSERSPTLSHIEAEPRFETFTQPHASESCCGAWV